MHACIQTKIGEPRPLHHSRFSSAVFNDLYFNFLSTILSFFRLTRNFEMCRRGVGLGVRGCGLTMKRGTEKCFQCFRIMVNHVNINLFVVAAFMSRDFFYYSEAHS